MAAGAPQMAPFMADECLLAMPDVDSVEYTMKEYMSFVEHIKACVERLNQQGESNRVSDIVDGDIGMRQDFDSKWVVIGKQVCPIRDEV